MSVALASFEVAGFSSLPSYSPEAGGGRLSSKVVTVMVAPNNLPPQREQGRTKDPSVKPIYCVVGETLCAIRVWSDLEWEQLDPRERPSHVVHVPGLGWVGAVVGPVVP